MQFNNHSKINILDYSRAELIDYVNLLGLEKYRADQLFRGLYQQNISSFTDLTTISKQLQKKLESLMTPRTFVLQKTTKSPHDQTTKFLWRLVDGLLIESVIIYEQKRITFCISSQVGCALDCQFCATGKMGFIRNLSTGEIVEQVLRMKSLAGGLPTNIVFMGMGEPLLNLKSVLKACYLLSDPEGLAFARKKITISTSGIAPGIRKLADLNAPFSLAISLNAVFEVKRRRLMPISARYPLEELAGAIEYYIKKLRRRVSFEYILIAGVNDTKADADKLLKFAARFPCKINLIPCNSVDPEYPPSKPDRVCWFNEYINQKQKTATTRMRKGWEIQAACGQLYAQNVNYSGVKITSGPVPKFK